MSRTIIPIQKAIFSHLEAYVARGGEPIDNPGADRWIAGDARDRAFLAGAEIKDVFKVSPRRTLARVDFRGMAYLCGIGFAGDDLPTGLNEVDLTPALLALVLYEAKPTPVATPLQVGNLVGALSNCDAGYLGHEFEVIASLFGVITVYCSEDFDPSETWRAYFEICVDTAITDDTWLDADIASKLLALSELAGLGLPFQTLCRSVFDADPASMFLALYRCLEALYAYSASKKLAREFGLELSWAEIATKIEKSLGWRPKEADSLLSLLKFARQEDLVAVLAHFGEEKPDVNISLLPDVATRRIYELRNNLVHYRPIHHFFEFKNVRLNEISATIEKIIRSIYSEIQIPHLKPDDD